MWTLFVISTIVGLEEPKVTRYGEYATQQECAIERAILEVHFQDTDEGAICTYVEQ